MVPVPTDDFDDDPTPHGFAVLLLAQNNRGGQKFVQAQGNRHLQTHMTNFFKNHKGKLQAQVQGRTPLSHKKHHTHTATISCWQDFDIFTSLARGVDGPTLWAPGPTVIPIKGGAYQPVQTAIPPRPPTGCSALIHPRLNAFCRTSP